MRRENRRQQIEHAQFLDAAVDVLENLADSRRRCVLLKFNGNNIVRSKLVNHAVGKSVGKIACLVRSVKFFVGTEPFAAVEDFIQREHIGGVFFFGLRQIPILALGFKFSTRRHGNNHVLNVGRIFNRIDSRRHVDVVVKFFLAIENFKRIVGEERAEKRSQPLLPVKDKMLRRNVAFVRAFNRAAGKI